MNMLFNRKAIIEKLSTLIDEKRFIHSLNVEDCAIELAHRLCVDETKASIAALLHDCAKNMDIEAAERLGYELNIFQNDKWLYRQPALWHAQLGVYIAKTEFNVFDQEILSAIECHTTGKAGMTKLDKIIYLADYIEPNRSFSHVGKIRANLKIDFNKALLEAYDNTIYYLTRRKRFIHPRTIIARNEAVENYYKQN